MLKDSVVEENQLRITYFIDSPVKEVYSAWTDPEKISKWMGPEGVTCEEVKADLHVGGEYSINMVTPEGNRIAVGEYKEIVPNERLVFTWHWIEGTFKNSLVTVDFDEQDGGTLILLMHELLPNKEQAEHHSMGWAGCLDCLKNYLN